MRKKKKRISDFSGFAKEFTKKWGSDTPSEIDLPNYLDEQDERKRKIKEMEDERVEKDENGEV
jgi:hypothetical protein